MKSIFIAISILALFAPQFSEAQVGTFTATNGATKVKKEYPVGVEYFDVDVSDVSGWNKCTVSPLKVFQYFGQTRKRLDSACSTKSGQLVSFSCTTGKGNLEVSITQLLGTGSKVMRNNQINTNGFMDIALTCDFMK